MAAVDYFLKLDGITGDSTVKGHEGEINVDSFSWGVSNSSSIGSGAGGAGTGKAQFQDFHLTMATSKASPDLFKKCVTGSHFQKAVLTCRKAGGESQGQDFLKFTLSDALISSYAISGDNSVVAPTDAVSLAFAKVEMAFSAQNPDGGIGSVISAGWDLKLNRAI
jgi:type VI secretion system secreted protein Hcp